MKKNSEKNFKQDVKGAIKLKKEISKIKKIKLLVLIFAMALLIILLSCIILTPKLKLKGKANIKIEYNEKYKEPGFNSFLFGNNYNKKVNVSGKVNTSKIGDYKITYTVKNFIFQSKTERIVHVIDDEKPKLELIGSTETFVCPNTSYKEEGYKAFDNYDGDITNKVETTVKDNMISYKISDSFLNKTQVIRKLIYEDNIKPVIKLKGYETTYLSLNSEYNEMGYDVSDNCSNDLNDKVKISGTVDVSKPGKYYLTYTVSDDSGNETSITRTVIVQNFSYSSSGCGLKGAIYLTFDDGPNSGTTDKILNILKEENVKGTFFVTNNGPDNLIKREYDEGHTVALHTASHSYSSVYASVDSYFKDLKIVSDRVKKITGYESKFIRFPGGSSNTVSRKYTPGIMSELTKDVVDRGYRYYDWNISSEDAGTCASIRTDKCVYDNVVKNLSLNKCNMVLMHDIKDYTANALKDIIKYGKENGYTFKAIDESTPMVRQKVNN